MSSPGPLPGDAARPGSQPERSRPTSGARPAPPAALRLRRSGSGSRLGTALCGPRAWGRLSQVRRLLPARSLPPSPMASLPAPETHCFSRGQGMNATRRRAEGEGQRERPALGRACSPVGGPLWALEKRRRRRKPKGSRGEPGFERDAGLGQVLRVGFSHTPKKKVSLGGRGEASGLGHSDGRLSPQGGKG